MYLFLHPLAPSVVSVSDRHAGCHVSFHMCNCAPFVTLQAHRCLPLNVHLKGSLCCCIFFLLELCLCKWNIVICVLFPTQSPLCSIMCVVVCCVERTLSESPLITCSNCKVPSRDSRRQSTVWTTQSNIHKIVSICMTDNVKWLRLGLQMHSRYGTILGHVAQLRLICC